MTSSTSTSTSASSATFTIEIPPLPAHHQRRGRDTTPPRTTSESPLTSPPRSSPVAAPAPAPTSTSPPHSSPVAAPAPTNTSPSRSSPVATPAPAPTSTTPVNSPPTLCSPTNVNNNVNNNVHIRTITANGATFDVLPPCACPEAVTIGDTVTTSAKRTAAGKIKATTTTTTTMGMKKTVAEEQWEERRREVLDERLRGGEERESDEEDVFWFTDAPLPEWIHAEREFQPDGRPGVYLLKPSYDDFVNRFEEMLEVVSTIGERLGAVKVKVPDEWLTPVVPYPTFLADYTRTHARDPPEPEIYTLSQRLPLHPRSTSSLSPIFSVSSTPNPSAPLSTTPFPHPPSPLSTIPESALLARGRTWGQILSGNPGGEVPYSSDNPATPDLRSFLGLADPRLCELPGNELKMSRNRVLGIHSPYLYLGAPYSTFALHLEDYAALSLNYHHGGAAKSWRVICPMDYWRVENLVADTLYAPSSYPNGSPQCSQFVRHASVFATEAALRTVGARSVHMQQRSGEMVVTWPMAYHQGWNEGGNVCEAVGYGGNRWRKGYTGDPGRGVYKPCAERCEKAGHGAGVTLEFGMGMGMDMGTGMVNGDLEGGCKLEEGVGVVKRGKTFKSEEVEVELDQLHQPPVKRIKLEPPEKNPPSEPAPTPTSVTTMMVVI